MKNCTYSVPCVFPPRYRGDAPVAVSVPGSKSITNRALLLATLARGTSVLDDVSKTLDSLPPQTNSKNASLSPDSAAVSQNEMPPYTSEAPEQPHAF